MRFSEDLSFLQKISYITEGPLHRLDSLLGAKIINVLKIKKFLKSSFVVNVKVHIIHHKKFYMYMFIQFRFIMSQSL